MPDERVVDLGVTLRKWQAEARKRFRRFNVLVVHRRGGKTLLAILTLVDAALRTHKREGRYAYVCPLRTQAKTVAWTYLKQFAYKVPHTRVSESELSVTFPNGAQVRLHGADNPDSLRGIYLDGVVIDEVADMKPQTWFEVLRPALADRGGWALFIGTVKGMNLLSEVYLRALKDPTWATGLYTVYDTDALDPREIEDAKRTMTPAQFAQEFMCDFGAGVENQLITMDAVRASQAKSIEWVDYQHAPRLLGIDPARYGYDRSVFMRRQGLCATWEPKVFKGLDNMELVAEAVREIEEWHPHVIFIDAGGGAGIIDRLNQLGHRCIEVPFGGKASSPAYYDKRSEMWAKVASWLGEGGVLHDSPELMADLVVPTYTFDNPRNALRMESKDKIRARGMPSPDLGDALALTFAHPVGPGFDGADMPPLDPYGVPTKSRNRVHYADHNDPWEGI